MCKSPEPTNGGYSCEGENVDVKPCTVRRCREYSGCFLMTFSWLTRLDWFEGAPHIYELLVNP